MPWGGEERRKDPLAANVERIASALEGILREMKRANENDLVLAAILRVEAKLDSQISTDQKKLDDVVAELKEARMRLAGTVPPS